MTNTDNTAIVPAAPTAPSVQLTALERYGRSGRNLYGELLKFSGKTGTWTSGAQGVEVPIGTQLAAIVPELVAGYVKWVDGMLAEEVLQPITEAYDPKQLRASLGDTDPAQWPRGDDGRAEDLWKEAACLPMQNPKTGAKYTYSTSSVGGTRAVKHLVATYAWQMRAAPETTANHLPVVELGARSYKHADRKRGTIYNPTLDGVDWVPASAVLDKNNDACTASSSFEDHRPEKQRKRRKASL
jgi:hypothetical protein